MKRTPEERRKEKMKEFAETKPDEGEEETRFAPPKQKTLRDLTLLETQTAHKEMCQPAWM